LAFAVALRTSIIAATGPFSFYSGSVTVRASNAERQAFAQFISLFGRVSRANRTHPERIEIPVFSNRLPLSALIEHCRALRHMLEAGLTMAQAMKHQAKTGPAAFRPVAKRLAESLEQGEDLQSALKEVSDRFPPLYLAIGSVAEETGTLPEALRELENFFTLQLSLWKKFISQITWPCVQFVLATIVVSLLIWILGVLSGGSHGMSVFGLQGASGAAAFFFTVWGIVLGLFVLLYFLRNVVGRGPMIDRTFMRLYAVGPMLEAMALSRFSLSMAVTMDAGVPIAEAARLAMNSTSNFAFIDRIPQTQSMLREGQTLTESLRAQHLFPDVYLDIVHTAEISGKEPDTFQRQARQYNEIAETRLKILSTAAYWLVWGIVAVFIIILIFNIYSQYLNQLNQIR
jgi:type II secretory pathway component PulF